MLAEILAHLKKFHIEYRLLGAFLTPVLVVFGWLVVNHQNNKREDRKELRKFIDDLLLKIDELENSCVNFHTNKKYKDSLAAEILSGHTKITAQLGRSRLECLACYDAAIAFHESFSEYNFAANEFKKQQHDSDLINNIHTQANLFKDQLETLFHNTARLTLLQQMLKYQQAIITFLAYLGILATIWLILSRVPT